MPENACPECGAAIAAPDLNIKEGVGLCRTCGKPSKLGDIAAAGGSTSGYSGLDQPPDGCAISRDGLVGTGRVKLRATVRSVRSAIVVGLIAGFWNGILSVLFVFPLISGWYTRLVGP